MSDNEQMRVRFAPSPTGHLHVGGARTAIFNWLLARHSGGSFILRIEDTDRERSTAESEAALIDDLKWLGLDWDEGPDVGGDHGPYRQSERLDIYRERTQQLIESNDAYYAINRDTGFKGKKDYSTDAADAVVSEEIPPDEGIARFGQDDDVVIRFRLPHETVKFKDLVRGDISLEADTVSDFVLLRSSGYPTYNFAAVVDDHAMGITHVIRGEDHLYNTLRQYLLYEALGVPMPHFAHVPLILAEDRSKLSKRHGASSVGELRRLGFLPAAVMNYLVLLGWSHPEHHELIDLDDMRRSFSLDRVGKAGAVYDGTKLHWMNGQYLRKLTPEQFADTSAPFMPAWVNDGYSDQQKHDIALLLQDSVETLSQLESTAVVFKQPPELEDEATEALRDEGAGPALDALKANLETSSDDLTPETFKAAIKDAGKTAGVKGKALFFPVRAALTGSVHGPDLATVATIKGREQVIELIDRARSAMS